MCPPYDITPDESIRMTVDEYEAVRLLDAEGLTQEASADRMNLHALGATAGGRVGACFQHSVQFFIGDLFWLVGANGAAILQNFQRFMMGFSCCVFCEWALQVRGERSV